VVVDGPMAQVHWERHQPRHVHNLWRALGHSLGVHTYFRSNRHAPPRCPTPAATTCQFLKGVRVVPNFSLHGTRHDTTHATAYDTTRAHTRHNRLCTQHRTRRTRRTHTPPHTREGMRGVPVWRRPLTKGRSLVPVTRLPHVAPPEE
jgi:hypothetical protein